MSHVAEGSEDRQCIWGYRKQLDILLCGSRVILEKFVTFPLVQWRNI